MVLLEVQGSLTGLPELVKLHEEEYEGGRESVTLDSSPQPLKGRHLSPEGSGNQT